MSVSLRFLKGLIAAFVALHLVLMTKAEESSTSVALIEAFKAVEGIDNALRVAYNVAQGRLAGMKFEALEADIRSSGGRELYATREAGRGRLLVSSGIVASVTGAKHDFAIDVLSDPKKGDLIQVSPLLISVFNRPLPYNEVLTHYPAGTVAARALALPRVQRETVDHPLVVSVEIAYKKLGWPLNPIRGNGYSVTIELSAKPADTSATSSVRLILGAFDVVETASVATRVSVSGSGGTRLVSMPGLSMLEEPGSEPAFILLGQSYGSSASENE